MIGMLALGIVLLLALVWASKWYVASEPKDLIAALKWALLTVAMMVVVWLALSGRLVAALAALPAIMVWLVRMFNGLRYAQMFKRMMGGQQQDQSQPPTTSSNMSRNEALKVLGLQEGAREAEIKAAHRRLMSHLHPDVGGSDYLAQQINQAKDVLLG